jgi:hypothetical protein
MPLDETLRTAMTATGELVKETLANLFEAESAYVARGGRLESVVSEAMTNRYLKLEPDRDALIKARANEVLAEIGAFSQLRASVFARVAVVRLSMDVSVRSVHLGVIRAAIDFPAVTGPTTETVVAQLRALRAALSRADAQAVTAAAKAIFIGEKVARGQQLAANIIILRQSELERFTKKEISANVEAILMASADILASQAREALAEEILKALLGAAFETAVPVLRLATVGIELADKVREMKERYVRSDVDEMFLLARRLGEQRGAAEKDLDYLNALTEALTLFAKNEG